jgi:hypothetical protein
MVHKDLLIVYNTFGGKNDATKYIEGLNSIFWHIDKNNLHNNVRVVVSSVLNQDECVNTLKNTFGTKLTIFRYDYRWPVQVSCNKTILASEDCFNEKYEGYFYISSGIILPEIDDLFVRLIEKNNTSGYGLIQLQVSDDQDGGMACLGERFTQDWFPNQHLDRNKDFLIGVGDYCNFHLGIYNRRLKEFYGVPITDVYGTGGMESALTYTSYALRLKNIMLNDSMCEHSPMSDSNNLQIQDFPSDSTLPINSGLLWGRTNDIFLNDIEGIDSGLGNYPGPYYGPPEYVTKVVLSHRKDKYDEEFLSTDERLKHSVKRCYFTNKNELDYDKIGYTVENLYDVCYLSSGYVHGLNTKKIVEMLNRFKCKTFILWQIWEYYAPQFMEYLEWDYAKYGEHSENIKIFEQTLIENNITFYVVLGGEMREKSFINYINHPIKNLKFLFWPTALLHYTYYGLKNNLGDVENLRVSNKYEKLYINYNGKPRYHRGMMMDYLCKYNLLDCGISTWHGKSVEYDFKYWNEQNISIDGYDGIQPKTIYTKELLEPNTFFSLVTESTDHKSHLFFTEKTYRQILLEHPFIVLGPINQNLKLMKYGFKIYDEIFEYFFDEISDVKYRVLGIIDNILDLKDLDYNKLYEIIKEKVKFNKNRAIEIVNHDNNIPIEIVNLYKENKECFLSLFRDFNNTFNFNYCIDSKFKLVDEIFKNK